MQPPCAKIIRCKAESTQLRDAGAHDRPFQMILPQAEQGQAAPHACANALFSASVKSPKLLATGQGPA